MSLPSPKPFLLGIKPYEQGKSKAGGAEKPVIKLSSNENPLGPSPKAIAAYREYADLHRYPDGSAAGIREAIAEVFGLDASRIVCGAGSDELINLLIHAYAGEGDEVLYSQYGFLMYKIYSVAHGATPVTAPETSDLLADVDALLAAVTPRTKLVFLANPNNPTGTLLPDSEVRRLRAGLPENVLLVLDAAYAEYVETADYDAGAKLVEETQNTVMLRTFSKIYGLPALRLGWGYAPAHVVDALQRIRSPFNVSSAAMVAGIAAVKDVEYTAHAVQHNNAERAKLAAALSAFGLKVVPSEANFLLIRFPTEAGKNAQDANATLLADGIIARDVGAYGLPEYLRITVGTEDENKAVIASLRKLF